MPGYHLLFVIPLASVWRKCTLVDCLVSKKWIDKKSIHEHTSIYIYTYIYASYFDALIEEQNLRTPPMSMVASTPLRPGALMMRLNLTIKSLVKEIKSMKKI